jgi:replication-associated recombination protein RarA
MDEDTFETLSRVANGDLRKAITTLQSAVRLRGPAVAPATVLDVAGAVPKVRRPASHRRLIKWGRCRPCFKP